MLCTTPDADQPSIAFAIDRSRSFIEGIVLDRDPAAITWDLHLEFDGRIPAATEDDDDRVFEEDGYLDLSGICAVVPSWRELAGRSVELSFDATEMHPILPDN